eukprot:Rhum_TRINITY_DN21381_c0_g1::Rhum_TRINITY_DN21381_c0_g1_i1::g.173910::m.173910
MPDVALSLCSACVGRRRRHGSCGHRVLGVRVGVRQGRSFLSVVGVLRHRLLPRLHKRVVRLPVRALRRHLLRGLLHLCVLLRLRVDLAAQRLALGAEALRRLLEGDELGLRVVACLRKGLCVVLHAGDLLAEGAEDVAALRDRVLELHHALRVQLDLHLQVGHAAQRQLQLLLHRLRLHALLDGLDFDNLFRLALRLQLRRLLVVYFLVLLKAAFAVRLDLLHLRLQLLVLRPQALPLCGPILQLRGDVVDGCLELVFQLGSLGLLVSLNLVRSLFESLHLLLQRQALQLHPLVRSLGLRCVEVQPVLLLRRSVALPLQEGKLTLQLLRCLDALLESLAEGLLSALPQQVHTHVPRGHFRRCRACLALRCRGSLVLLPQLLQLPRNQVDRRQLLVLRRSTRRLLLLLRRLDRLRVLHHEGVVALLRVLRRPVRLLLLLSVSLGAALHFGWDVGRLLRGGRRRRHVLNLLYAGLLDFAHGFNES